MTASCRSAGMVKSLSRGFSAHSPPLFDGVSHRAILYFLAVVVVAPAARAVGERLALCDPRQHHGCATFGGDDQMLHRRLALRLIMLASGWGPGVIAAIDQYAQAARGNRAYF
jgi:hypothetical protein